MLVVYLFACSLESDAQSHVTLSIHSSRKREKEELAVVGRVGPTDSDGANCKIRKHSSLSLHSSTHDEREGKRGDGKEKRNLAGGSHQSVQYTVEKQKM